MESPLRKLGSCNWRLGMNKIGALSMGVNESDVMDSGRPGFMATRGFARKWKQATEKDDFANYRYVDPEIASTIDSASGSSTAPQCLPPLAPNGSFRIRWDVFIMFLLLYVSLVLPVTICFQLRTDVIEASPMGIMEKVVDFFFLVDLVLNFHTAVEDEDGNMSYSRKHIAMHYLRGWFCIDLVSIIPIDLLIESEFLGILRLFKSTRLLRLAKILRLMKIMKMLRLLRLPRILHTLETLISRAVLNLTSFLFAALLICHISACFFYYTASLGDLNNSWVGNEFEITPEGEPSVTKFELYVTALYWALSTMTTVGYGDVVPESVIEKIVSMLAMLAGATVFAYLSGAMSTMLSALNVEDARIAEKRQAVEDFVKERNLPPLLGARLRKYYQYVMQHSIYSEEMSIIQGLSASLRTEVVLFLYRGALEKVPFFKGKHPQFIVQLVSHLKMEFYSPGDIVALQGDAGPEMYFVSSGNLEVRLYPHLDGMTGLGTGKRTIPARSNLKPSLQQQQDVYRGRVRDKEQDRPPWEWIRRLARRVAQWRTGASPAPSPQKPDGAGGLMSMLKWSKPEAPSTRLPPNYRVLSLLGVGQYFGEYSCLTGDKRLATVVALDFCELYRLTRSDLNDVIKDWPNIGNELANLRGTMKTSMMTVEEQLRILKIMGYKRTNSGYVANLQNASKASARQSDADLMSSGAMMPANSEEAKMGAMPPSLPPLSIRKSSLVGSASPDSAGGEDDRQELPRIAPRKAGREAMQPLSMDAPVQQPQLPSAASSTTSDTSDTDGSASRTSHALAAAV